MNYKKVSDRLSMHVVLELNQLIQVVQFGIKQSLLVSSYSGKNLVDCSPEWFNLFGDG